MATDDDLRKELVSLRGRRGMVAGATARCTAWLEVLGISGDELERLIRDELDDMPQNREVLALKAAYGVNYGDLSTLDGRRVEYGASRPEAPKPETLETWEEKALLELATRLRASARDGAAKHARIISANFWQGNLLGLRITEHTHGGSITEARFLVTKHFSGLQVPPLLLYEVPKDLPRNCIHLVMTASFGGTVAPTKAWAIEGTSYLEAIESRTPIPLKHDLDGMPTLYHTWDTPQRGRTYGLFWAPNQSEA